VRTQEEFCVTGLDAAIYLGCDTAQALRSVARQIDDSFSEGDIRARMDSFRDARLMVEMDGHYLSLAVWRRRATREQWQTRILCKPLPEPLLGITSGFKKAGHSRGRSEWGDGTPPECIVKPRRIAGRAS
jgi:hypothetical protein